MTKQEELKKLEAQLVDERFLAKAPASAIQKVKDRIEKLKREMIPQLDGFEEFYCTDCGRLYWLITINGVTTRTPAKTFEEGEGFEEEDRKEFFGKWFAMKSTNEIVYHYPRRFVSTTLTFETALGFARAWIEINEYCVTPNWFMRHDDAAAREAEKAERKLYRKLHKKYGGEPVVPESTGSDRLEQLPSREAEKENNNRCEGDPQQPADRRLHLFSECKEFHIQYIVRAWRFVTKPVLNLCETLRTRR